MIKSDLSSSYTRQAALARQYTLTTKGLKKPLSNRDNEAVRPDESRYANSYRHRQPQVMDVMDVPLIVHRPSGFQQENWLLDPQRKWRVVDRIKWDDLAGMVDPVAPLWNTGSPGQSRRNDRIPIDRANKIRNSLRLIHVGRLTLRVLNEVTQYGKRRRVRGTFIHCEHVYRLWVTDSQYENDYYQNPMVSIS